MLWEVVGLESVIQVSDLLLQVFRVTDADCSVLKALHYSSQDSGVVMRVIVEVSILPQSYS